MELKFQVEARIAKPVSEVFDAVVNAEKLSRFFTTGGATVNLEEGADVLWKFPELPEQEQVVKVIRIKKNEKIILARTPANLEFITQVEIQFENLGGVSTRVRISESGWKNDVNGLKSSYSSCNGWAQMLTCMKGYLEFGINLSEGYW